MAARIGQDRSLEQRTFDSRLAEILAKVASFRVVRLRRANAIFKLAISAGIPSACDVFMFTLLLKYITPYFRQEIILFYFSGLRCNH
jgi:energy-converting hydrogenase Eha subunit H